MELISRDEAIEVIESICNTPCNQYFVNAVKSLPTIEERKKGERIDNKWKNLFKTISDLQTEAENEGEKIEEYRHEDWYDREDGFWAGVYCAMEKLKEVYDDINAEIERSER